MDRVFSVPSFTMGIPVWFIQSGPAQSEVLASVLGVVASPAGVVLGAVVLSVLGVGSFLLHAANENSMTANRTRAMILFWVFMFPPF